MLNTFSFYLFSHKYISNIEISPSLVYKTAVIDIPSNWSRAIQVELIQRKKSLPVLTEETKTSPSGRRAKSSEPFAKK